MKKIYLLALILFIAAFLRLYRLDAYPPSVTGDEIQQGYSTYSILKTGRDEWGDLLPINPRSFGDYKPALYVYTLIPFEGLLRMDIQTVRLPSAVFGTLTVLVFYLLATELFASVTVGMIAAFLLAIAPWHTQFSRLAWESNLGTFFFCLATLLLVKAFNKSRYLIPAAFIFGLTLFSYHSYKVFALTFLVAIFFLYKKQILKLNRRHLITSLVIGALAFLLIAYGMFFSGAGRRAADAAIYNSENIIALRNTQVKDPLPQPWGRVINNRVQYLMSQFTQNYIGYYSFDFLFSGQRSDSTLFNLPGKGLLYIWQLIPLLFGGYLLIRKPIPWSKLIFAWLLLAPIPAALTREYMHTQRVETILPIYTLISAFGLYTLMNWIRSPSVRKTVIALFIIVAAWSVVGRIDHYLFHTFNNPLGGFQYGYNQVIKYTEANKDKYDEIVFTKAYSEPQAFVAFYSGMDPKYYQSYSKNWLDFEERGFKFLDMTNYKLGKYYFRNIDWDKDKLLANTLVVASPRELPDNIIPVFVVNGPFGKPNFIVVDTNTIQP